MDSTDDHVRDRGPVDRTIQMKLVVGLSDLVANENSTLVLRRDWSFQSGCFQLGSI